MSNDNNFVGPYMDRKEDVTWVLLTFFSSDPLGQERLLPCFTLSMMNPFNDLALHQAEVLREIAWCYQVYKMDFEAGSESSKLASELSVLFTLMGAKDFLHLWSIRCLTDHPIWSLVRRLSTLLLKEWGMDPLPSIEQFDLDEFGSERSYGEEFWKVFYSAIHNRSCSS